MKYYIVFPSDFFDRRAVDPDLAREYAACRDGGLFGTLLFDYEKWFHGGKLVLAEQPETPCCAVYRGWMMKPGQYAAFFEARGMSRRTRSESEAAGAAAALVRDCAASEAMREAQRQNTRADAAERILAYVADRL